jgi:hypothetical protein
MGFREWIREIDSPWRSIEVVIPLATDSFFAILVPIQLLVEKGMTVVT